MIDCNDMVKYLQEKFLSKLAIIISFILLVLSQVYINNPDITICAFEVNIGILLFSFSIMITFWQYLLWIINEESFPLKRFWLWIWILIIGITVLTIPFWASEIIEQDIPDKIWIDTKSSYYIFSLYILFFIVYISVVNNSKDVIKYLVSIFSISKSMEVRPKYSFRNIVDKWYEALCNFFKK